MAERVSELERQLAAALARIEELEKQLAPVRKDSSTSSKPPSSDIVNDIGRTPLEPIKRLPACQ